MELLWTCSKDPKLCRTLLLDFLINVCWAWLYRMRTNITTITTWFLMDSFPVPAWVSFVPQSIGISRLSSQAKCLAPLYTTWEITGRILTPNYLGPFWLTALLSTSTDLGCELYLLTHSRSLFFMQEAPASRSHQALVRGCNVHF